MSGEFAAAVEPYSRTLRRLHLAIAIFVVALAVTGFMIYYRRPLGLQSLKLALVYVHAGVAYLFLIAFFVRIYLGFRGSDAVRFSHTLPRASDLRRILAFRRLKFAGRSPLSRMLAGLLFAAIFINALTGLVRAGTDVYFPPFGPFVQQYLAADGVRPAEVRPGDYSTIDAAKLKIVNRLKIPFGKIHIYGAFFIATLTLFHAIGAALTEWTAANDMKARGRARLMLFGPRSPR